MLYEIVEPTLAEEHKPNVHYVNCILIFERARKDLRNSWQNARRYGKSDERANGGKEISRGS